LAARRCAGPHASGTAGGRRRGDRDRDTALCRRARIRNTDRVSAHPATAGSAVATGAAGAAVAPGGCTRRPRPADLTRPSKASCLARAARGQYRGVMDLMLASSRSIAGLRRRGAFVRRSGRRSPGHDKNMTRVTPSFANTVLPRRADCDFGVASTANSTRGFAE
jgi:hypothetical protein